MYSLMVAIAGERGWRGWTSPLADCSASNVRMPWQHDARGDGTEPDAGAVNAAR